MGDNVPFALLVYTWTILGVIAIPILGAIVPALFMSLYDAAYEWSLETLAQWTQHKNDKVGRHWKLDEPINDNFFTAILQERRAVLAGLQREWSING